MKFHRSCHRWICIQAEFGVRSSECTDGVRTNERARVDVAFRRGFGRAERGGKGQGHARAKGRLFFGGRLASSSIPFSVAIAADAATSLVGDREGRKEGMKKPFPPRCLLLPSPNFPNLLPSSHTCRPPPSSSDGIFYRYEINLSGSAPSRSRSSPPPRKNVLLSVARAPIGANLQISHFTRPSLSFLRNGTLRHCGTVR